MKVFITGSNGQLGSDLMQELNRRGHECVGSGRMRSVRHCGSAQENHYVPLDITDSSKLKKVLWEIKPDAVIHCAAWTAVDAAEEIDNIPKVYAVNATATRNIAETCRELNCKLIYPSTDYVFDGSGSIPWQPECKKYNPLNHYGKSKLMGELAVSNTLEKYFIVRIEWAYGMNGMNFVKTMLNLSKSSDRVFVVNDQIGIPTFTFDLARLFVDMLETEKYGYYHATNTGRFISWYDFACEIYRLANVQMEVIPVSSESYKKSKAKRPLNSRLNIEKLTAMGFETLPSWGDAIARYIGRI